MTAAQARKRIDEFLATGRPGRIELNVASPGQPGKRGVVTVVEIHERLALTRGEPDTGILDGLDPQA